MVARQNRAGERRVSCQVVNIRTHKSTEVRYIGRGSIFGNPFKLGEDGTRDEVIEKYKFYFYDRLSWDSYFKDRVESLRGCVIGCFCKPQACHGDIIKEYLDGS